MVNNLPICKKQRRTQVSQRKFYDNPQSYPQQLWIVP